MPNYAGKNLGLIGKNCEKYIIMTGSKVRLSYKTVIESCYEHC